MAVKKILINEETIESTTKMLERLRRSYQQNSCRIELEKKTGWQEKMAKYEIRAAEVAMVLSELYYALDND